MRTEKRKKLEAAGWRVGAAKDFLHLSEAEAAYVETKLKLADRLEAVRKERHLTQKELATMLKTSQSRLALMEKGDSSVSIDLLVRALGVFGIEFDCAPHGRPARKKIRHYLVPAGA